MRARLPGGSDGGVARGSFAGVGWWASGFVDGLLASGHVASWPA